MSATILPFRSNNPETDLLARRNAEEWKRRLRDEADGNSDAKWVIDYWFNRFTPDTLDRLCSIRKPTNSSRDHGFNPSPDGGAA